MADDYGARLQAVTATRGFVGGGSCIHAVEHTLDDGPRTFCGRIPSWVSDERLENFPGCMTCVRVIFSRTDLIAPPSN